MPIIPVPTKIVRDGIQGKCLFTRGTVFEERSKRNHRTATNSIRVGKERKYFAARIGSGCSWNRGI